MTGDKGTGKTLTISLLANRVITELNMPVIMIREAYSGEQFDQFIQSIGECCLMFDEFGKMYGSTRHEDKPHQEKLLSLFDGADKTKRLIILTENDELYISEFMLNRPSRVYYHFRYRKLDEDSIVGYCGDHGVSTAVIRDIVDLSRRSKIFSFDVLQTIVEEHVRYGSSIEDTIEELNIDIRQQSLDQIRIVKVVDKQDGSQIPLATTQAAVVDKPMGSYDYTHIKLDIGSEIVPDEPTGFDKLDGTLAAVSSNDDEDNEVSEIYIRDQDVAYESTGTIIYETKRYTVAAKDVPKVTTIYGHMF